MRKLNSEGAPIDKAFRESEQSCIAEEVERADNAVAERRRVPRPSSVAIHYSKLRIRMPSKFFGFAESLKKTRQRGLQFR